ncbi:hypothetical protein P9X10_02850 [Bacillus cereus]|nr:hypothetical protein [Bacillus cereus]
MSTKSITEEDMIQLYVKEGKTDKEIGQLRGLTREGVSYLRKQYGIPTRPRTSISESRLYELYVNQKLTDKQIAKLEGVSSDTVYVLRKKYGIQANKQGKMLTKEQLHQLYVVEGLSDNKIAELLGVMQGTVTNSRALYGIETRESITSQSIPYVVGVLNKLGFKVENLREQNTNSYYDLLLNDSIRIDIRTKESIYDEKFMFDLRDKQGANYNDSSIRLQLSGNRTKRNIHITCDYLICVGFMNNKPKCWVIPSKDLKPDLQAIGIRPLANKSKYHKYEEAWDLLK